MACAVVNANEIQFFIHVGEKKMIWLAPSHIDLPEEAETPCFVVDHAGVRHNLERVAGACGGSDRLVPHIKTHRAPWLVADLLEQGVSAFKAATPAEVEMLAEAGAREIIWAYPSVSVPGMRRVVATANRFPDIRFSGLVGAAEGIDTWLEVFAAEGSRPFRLRVDLDSGMGRTGFPLNPDTAANIKRLIDQDLFGGWHAYDGHIKGADKEARARQVEEQAAPVYAFVDSLEPGSAPADLIVGGSSSFELWPRRPGLRVAPGSWVYSSTPHRRDLPHHDWRATAFVVATVIMARDGIVTLNAGAKGIGADPELADRFKWPGAIVSMSEEHTVVENDTLKVGDRVALHPGHCCTTAYLYRKAWVLGLDGTWSERDQMGNER
jgi:3-hydroxy-D-aspartate aldolase